MHIETRPARLLPPASTTTQKLDRGVCPLCFVRLAECFEVARLSRERMFESHATKSERFIRAVMTSRTDIICSREGCKAFLKNTFTCQVAAPGRTSAGRNKKHKNTPNPRPRTYIERFGAFVKRG